MKPGKADILPGLETPILGYDGRFPGPTIRATRGRAVQVLQRNQSGRELNVHLHGGVTLPQFDGHPHDAIPNGAERLYKYPNVAALGDALVPRPRARRDGQDAVRRAGRVLHRRGPRRQGGSTCRRATTTSR